jgi:hypothetical protein
MIGCWLCWPAAAGEFSEFFCLQALFPATDSHWVRAHRTEFSMPQLSPEKTAIAISQWKNGRLLNVFVFTEKSFRRFDRAKSFGSEEVRDLQSMDPDWLRHHLLAVKSESLEVFKIPIEPPGGWDRSRSLSRFPASETELGGWLIEAASPGDTRTPIRKEIALRKKWVQENNLDKDRFKAWLKADKVCSGR